MKVGKWCPESGNQENRKLEHNATRCPVHAGGHPLPGFWSMRNRRDITARWRYSTGRKKEIEAMTITPSPNQEALIQAAIQAGLIRSAQDALDLGLRQLLDRIPSQPKLIPSEPSMKRSMVGDIPVFAIGKPMPVEMIQETIDAIRMERDNELTRAS